MNEDERRFEEELAGADGLRLVRLRLWAALLLMFAIPLGIAAPVVYGLATANGAPMVVPTVAIAGAAMILGLLTVWLARRVLEPAERLDRAREWLGEAYRRAHEESLRDPLTGLGNHRAFQEELDRELSGAERYGNELSVALIDLDDFRGSTMRAVTARAMRPCRRSGRCSSRCCADPTGCIAWAGMSSP